MRKTKIIATLGPASSSATMVEQLIQAGANVFRLNFSHGSPEQHLALAAKIRACAARLDREIGILADLQGPKIRIASFADGSIRATPSPSMPAWAATRAINPGSVPTIRRWPANCRRATSCCWMTAASSSVWNR
ncbi:hypothetical protein WP7S18E06_00280 [Aeromonas hydrophila]|nr:hypothetical protein WP7S18E06_00280 [Aeromonas hydrophila]